MVLCEVPKLESDEIRGRDQWRSEAQKLKRQFEQKMTSGNLGSPWTLASRDYPSPACSLGDKEANNGPVGGPDSDATNETDDIGEIRLREEVADVLVSLV